MLTIKNVTIKNFLSVGNVTQAVTIHETGLTLVLGNNVDMGGDGSRNGVGKTTLINAISYALFGSALFNIKKSNLINKINNKNMIVTVDFEKNGVEYRIERGRSPNIFKFFVNNIDNSDVTDEGQGEGRMTQVAIEKVISMTHTMFKHIVALNTYTEPFLSMRANDQRELIEQLLGITLLSDKAELLKELVRTSKDTIQEENYRVRAVEDANERFNNSIKDLERRRKLWHKANETSITELESELMALEQIDVEKELEAHIAFDAYTTKKKHYTTLTKDIAKLTTTIDRELKRLDKATEDLAASVDHKCYACGQDVHDDKHEQILLSKSEAVAEYQEQIDLDAITLNSYTEQLNNIGDLGTIPNLFYNTAQEAYEHQNKLSNTINDIERKTTESDPYQEQIDTLKNTGLQDVNWDELNRLTDIKEHQDFLLKLLTNKDSFIRKRIIEQNLHFLNVRLDHYITQLGLPHEVKFQSDLSVSIVQLGQDLDFDNLSRGERNRLILGLSWAFRDVYESMNSSINLMCIDELIDSGMDSVGVESALTALKKMERERNKDILLISHRDELIGRVNSVLQVTKENGFTTFSTETEIIDT